MSLTQKITQDLTDAMKARDKVRVSCLRMLKTHLKNRQVEIGRELEDSEVQSLISSLIRKNREAAEEFRRGGRADLADNEELEIKVLYDYLPEQLTPEELEKILREIIAQVEAKSPKDLGTVMKAAMARVAGKAQGKEVSEIARKLLG